MPIHAKQLRKDIHLAVSEIRIPANQIEPHFPGAADWHAEWKKLCISEIGLNAVFR